LITTASRKGYKGEKSAGMVVTSRGAVKAEFRWASKKKKGWCQRSGSTQGGQRKVQKWRGALLDGNENFPFLLAHVKINC